MRHQRVLTIVFGLIVAIAAVPPSVWAHEPHECPAGLPDAPALEGHLAQTDISQGRLTFQQIFDAGQDRFEAVWNRCDGQGRPATTGTGDSRAPTAPTFIRTSAPDSNACAGCHNQPRAGGGGDFVANVFVLAQGLDPVTESVSAEFSNERNTLGMFGAGPIEMLARELTTELQIIRDLAVQEASASGAAATRSLYTKGINFGQITAQPDGSLDTTRVVGVDPDLIVRPFHQAGVVVSIREFTVNAFNHHHGMQAEERFDLNPAKGVDFDQDGIAAEMTIGDITAVTIFQAALGTPGQVLPVDPAEGEAVTRGEALMAQIGCTSCHAPQMPLDSPLFVEPNPFNPEGTFSDTGQSFSFDLTAVGEGPRLERASDGVILVRAYTDLKRHNLCDDPNHPDPIRFFCDEQLAQNRPDQGGRPGAEFFLTRKLWDVGNSAPYGHRGNLTTISEAILAHGGEARSSQEAFIALSTADQAAVVKFLKTLQVVPAGSPRVFTAQPDPAAIVSSSGEGTVASVPFIAGLGLLALVAASAAYVLLRRRAARVES
jgi:hypothetical protein